MTLSEAYSKPIKEVIDELELSDMKIYSDNHGNVKVVELKYTEKEPVEETGGHVPARNPFI